MTMLEPTTNPEAPADLPFIAEKAIRRAPVRVEPLREPPTNTDLFALQRRFDQFISQLNSQGNRNWTGEHRSPEKGVVQTSLEHLCKRRPKLVPETHGD